MLNRRRIQRVYQLAAEIEIEAEINPFSLIVIFGDNAGIRPHFADQHDVRVQAFDVLVEIRPKFQRFFRIGLAGIWAGFDGVADRVQTEAVKPLVNPEFRQFLQFLDDVWVAEIQIRLAAVESGIIIFAALFVENPDPFRLIIAPIRMFRRRPRLAPLACGNFLAPDKIIGIWINFLRRFFEPVVLRRNVIQHEVGDDLNAAFFGFLQKFVKIGHRAVIRFHLIELLKIVAVIRRGFEHRRQPDAGDSQVREIIQLRRHALEIADAVPV